MPELPSPAPAATRRIPIVIASVLVGAVLAFQLLSSLIRSPVSLQKT